MMQVDRLSYRVANKEGLKEISFSLEEKGICGLLGPKNSGKTLLLDLLSGVKEADSGTVMIGDIRMDRTQNGLRAKIGYVPQDPFFYAKMTVSELLNFVGEARHVLPDKRYRQIEEALALTELTPKANCLTDRLSKEERKKLSLAAALLGNTEILLLDEPFWGNTDEKRQACMDLLRMLGKHKIVLIASRDLNRLKELCDRLLLLSDGMLLADNSFTKLEEQLSKKGAASLEEIYAMLNDASTGDIPLTSAEEPNGRKEIF